MKRKTFNTMRFKIGWALMILNLCLMSFFAFGCDGSDDSLALPENSNTGNSKMTVSPDTLYLKADGTEKGSFQIKLQKVASFFAKAEKDWCKLANAEGYGNSAYTVSVTSDPNTQTVDRTSRISFYSGEYTGYAYVVQKAAEKVKDITITPDTLFLDAEIGSKGTVTVHLIDNATYDTGGTSHFGREIVEEDGGKVLKIHYTVIHEYNKDLIIKMGVQQHDVQKFYYVCQKAKKQEADDKYNITISPDEHNIEASAGQIFSLIEVDKETAITVTSDADWCTPINSNFENPSTAFKLYMNVNANTGNETRKANVTVRAGASSKTCTIIQQGGAVIKPAIGGTVANAVDLGLSVKWASHNLGADSEEKPGIYFAWGETKEKDFYEEDNYEHFNYDEVTYKYIGKNISGTKYDAAHVNWGDGWRLPTMDEFKELIDKCKWKWSRVGEIKGYRVTGPNGNSIFLPTTGLIWGGTMNNRSISGYYWSGIGNEEDDKVARIVWCNDDGAREWDKNRFYGIPIRPVKKGGNTGDTGGYTGGAGGNTGGAGGGIVNGE